MECLHGEPVSSSKTTNGVFFYCGQKPSCNFFCPQNDCSYFHNAIAIKMLVMKDIFKPSFGRPFFVCSEKKIPVHFGNAGDVIRPQCYHGVDLGYLIVFVLRSWIY